MEQVNGELSTTDIVLSEEQEAIKKEIIENRGIYFVTGKAGTGKSTLLQEFKKELGGRLVVTAPTGIAALNVGGQTIHSLFGIPPSYCGGQSLKPPQKVRDFLALIDTVIIDEVSMVRADLLDAIDYTLRVSKRSDEPFGGVRLIMFGDVFQLPPIISDLKIKEYFKDHYGGPYFFNANVWENAELNIRELKTIHRQKDEKLISLLNNVREGKITGLDIDILNSRLSRFSKEDKKGFITVGLTNKAVLEINTNNLKALPSRAETFKALITGQFEPAAYPTEPELVLKEGAAIMMLRNDKDRRWVNGSLGTVHAIEQDSVYVEFANGEVHMVTPVKWEKTKYVYDAKKKKITTKVVGEFEQLPLKLAWAITCHKSQGQTFEKMVLDVGRGAFTHGQTYVALSRCTSLKNLYLTSPINRRDVIVDPLVKNFAENPVNLL